MVTQTRITMHKLPKKWIIKVSREIEEPFVDVMESDFKPTERQIIKWLSEEHFIDDDPKHTKYEIIQELN